MERSRKIIIPNTRPISEGDNKGNVNTRPDGPKPAAIAKPEGQPASSSGNGSSQGSSGQRSTQGS